MLASWDVEVTQESGGDLVIWERTRKSDGSGGEGRCWGPCPTAEQPLRGPGSFEPGVGIVYTVATNVDKVTLHLSDGSEHSCQLLDVEGGDARWFRHETLNPEVSPVLLTAFAADGDEMGRFNFRRPSNR